MSSTTTTPPPSVATTKRGARAESAASAAKKHHVCPVCERGFSTTGHLARHARVHTGERNHKCPFPGCETKCSRQDNLQQHYRIHLSPGSRRKSGRTVLRNRSTPEPSPPAPSPSSSNENPYGIREDSPPLSPPPLEDSRLYYFNAAHGGAVESPPASPPPLVEAYHPAYPNTHRVRPQIDTSSRMGSPVEEYWSTSSASDDYGPASAYPSPSAYPSCSTSAYPSPTSQYPPSPGHYASAHVHPHPHPHTFRHASHSPAAAAVPVARSLTARHSIANISAHAQLQRPTIEVHHPVPQAAHYVSPVARHSPQAYTVPSQASQVLYPAGSYQQMEPQPDTPSPPPSSQHSPQTPYTPFRESADVYCGQAAYPLGGEHHGGVQYDDAGHMHTVYAEAAYVAHSPLSPHDVAYRETYGAPQSQSAPFASYDERAHLVNYAYEGVPAMQFHGHQSGQETYAKHPQAPVYADAAAPKTYSPLLLDALPSLRREPVGGENYAVERAEGEVGASQSSSLAGYAGRDGEPRYATHTRPPSPSAQDGCESYVVGAYPVAQVPYLHHPQPQPPLTGEYLADYGWRATEVQ
ncbi:hypothetical protein DFH08DRAFT_902913 [Mycena albidolilacea]|uniref:C2H2-type domain-containing protein n=1 Tax=Mycena albidolilacea TaxID=1033008 RepID=A0AAD6Z3H1_9AGAR|nr:hypothetical protein DFH08DRAFT_902913 [Mycena albidolilacea]